MNAYIERTELGLWVEVKPVAPKVKEKGNSVKLQDRIRATFDKVLATKLVSQ